MKPKALRFLLVLLVSVTPSLGQDGSARNDQPNILLITIDTLRADHLSCYGYDRRTSPTIDALAASGVRFEQTYSPIPLTGPSHISLFASRFPQEHGARINGIPTPVDSKWMYLPQILKRFGYYNLAFVSAWPLTSHLTGLSGWFDIYDDEMNRRYQFWNSSRFAEDVTPRAISWLSHQRIEPFFLWIHYFDPHAPYHLRRDFVQPKTNGKASAIRNTFSSKMKDRILRYDSEISYVDYHLSLLLKALDKTGLRDSTLLILTSDHGESLGEHDYVGHGRHLYEPILRVPLIMRYPKRIPPGKVISTPVSLLDVTPTLLELSGLTGRNPPIPATFAGRSLAGAIQHDEALLFHPIRFLTFSGKKGWTPSWLSFSWAWLKHDRMPLRLGQLHGPTKSVWAPREKSLHIFDLAQDSHELDPIVVSSENDRFEEETTALKLWFKATDLTEADLKRARRDEEILKSLGYTQ